MVETRNGKRKECGGRFDEFEEINDDNNVKDNDLCGGAKYYLLEAVAANFLPPHVRRRLFKNNPSHYDVTATFGDFHGNTTSTNPQTESNISLPGCTDEKTYLSVPSLLPSFNNNYSTFH